MADTRLNKSTGDFVRRKPRRAGAANHHIKTLLVIFVAVGIAFSVGARPAQVILLRHAEKPDDESIPHLSARGQRRAVALVDFLITNPALTNAGPPAILIAPRPTRDRASRRPIETLEPLAKKLMLPVQTPFRAKDWKSLAASLLNDPGYDGKNVVVCWVHDSISRLAAALGAPAGSIKWSGDVYDRVWLITFSENRVKLTTIQQALLPGDKGRKHHNVGRRGKTTKPDQTDPGSGTARQP